MSDCLIPLQATWISNHLDRPDDRTARQYFSAVLLRLRNVSAFSIQVCWKAAARAGGRSLLIEKKSECAKDFSKFHLSRDLFGMEGLTYFFCARGASKECEKTRRNVFRRRKQEGRRCVSSCILHHDSLRHQHSGLCSQRQSVW